MKNFWQHSEKMHEMIREDIKKIEDFAEKIENNPDYDDPENPGNAYRSLLGVAINLKKQIEVEKFLSGRLENCSTTRLIIEIISKYFREDLAAEQSKYQTAFENSKIGISKRAIDDEWQGD